MSQYFLRAAEATRHCASAQKAVLRLTLQRIADSYFICGATEVYFYPQWSVYGIYASAVHKATARKFTEGHKRPWNAAGRARRSPAPTL